MGEIRLSVGQVNISGYLVINIREVANPGAVVASQVIPPPVPAVQNLVFTGLNEVVHYVDFRESSDGVSAGTLLSTYVYDVTSGAATFERRFYTAGGAGANDPAVDASSITDPYLEGKNIIGVFKEGFRHLQPDLEFTQVGDTITVLSSFAVPDPSFGNQEVIGVEIAYATSTSSSTASQNFPKDVIEITSDTTLSSTHYNNLIEARGSGTILTITLPSFSGIPDGVKFGFNTDNGDQRYLAIVCPAGSYGLVGKKQRGAIYMGKGEQLTVIKKSNYLRIISWTGDHLRVGDRVTKDGTAPLNSLPETGGWYLKSEYPRLWEWYINELPPADIHNASDDANLAGGIHSAKWAVGTTKFWVPDRRGFTDKIASGSRRAGDIEGPNVGQFNLTGNFPKIQKSGTSNQIVALGNINDANIGTQAMSIPVNIGQENRVLNAAVFSYRII
jgi:hypothetical protein